MTFFSNLCRISSTIPFRLKLIWIILIAYLLQLISINVFPLTFDEGVDLLIAHLIENGYQPYTDIFVSRLPLFILILSTVWTAAAGSLLFTKVVFVSLNLISLISLGGVGLKFFGEKEALLSVTLLAISTPYMAASSVLTADKLSVTFGNLAVLLTLVYLENADRKWLIGAGCFLAIAVLIELIVLHIAFVILILLAARQSSVFRWEGARIKLSPSLKDSAIDTATLLAASFGTIIVVLLLSDWAAGYEFSIGFKLTLREAIPFSIQDNMYELLQFLADNALLALGMLLGLLFAQNCPKHVIWFLLIWWLIAVFWLMIQIPLQEQHVVVLWAPMALAASWGFVRICEWLADIAKSHWKSSALVRAVPSYTLISILVIYVGLSVSQVPGLVYRAQNIRDQEDLRQAQAILQAASFVKQVTAPDDCVISDDPVLSLLSNRFPPPALSDPSHARFASGSLDLEKVKGAAVENNCKAVIATSHGFKQTVPDMTTWMMEFYTHHVNFEGIDIYYQGP